MPSAHQLQLFREGDRVRLSLTTDTGTFAHTQPAATADELAAQAHATLADSMPPSGELRLLGRALGEFLGPVFTEIPGIAGPLWITSEDADLLNLPFELLPDGDRFLFESGHLWLRRSRKVPLGTAPPVARPGPLRVLFMASSPQDENRLAFEKEEEAMIKIALRSGRGFHLEIEETGTFEGLREKVVSYRPHVVHLSGHGTLEDGEGYFCFENERGSTDARAASEMAALIFQNSGVSLAFVSGCESAMAGVTGVCEELIASGHVPLALGWGASVADDLATVFAQEIYRDLGAGREIDPALAGSRNSLLARCRLAGPHGEEILREDFALARLFAADPTASLLDPHLPEERPPTPSFRYQQLGDSIVGLAEGFVGRRRLLQRTSPPLRAGDEGRRILLLTGIGGVGKSTLTTRLANRFSHDGWELVAIKPRRDEQPTVFITRLLGLLSTKAGKLQPPHPYVPALVGDAHSLEQRLGFALEILNDRPLLLVLDNLESLLAAPPAAPTWNDPLLATFFTELVNRLTGESRAILTSRYVPPGLEADAAPLALHVPMPDFTEADFLKYLEYDDRIARRLAAGELTQEILLTFYRKLGATPRFVKQSLECLATLDPDQIRASLDRVGGNATTAGGDTPTDDAILRLQQEYFADIFLPQLYDGLSPALGLALSRLAVCDVALPADGIAAICDLAPADLPAARDAWVRLGLLQVFDDQDGPDLYGTYPLQEAFLTDEARLPAVARIATHRAVATYLRQISEQDRESDLGLSFMAVYGLCLPHAQAADDEELLIWAAKRSGIQLHQASEFRTLLAVAEGLLATHRHPEFLKLAADALLELGDWPKARTLLEEARPGFASIGDRAGEAASWHQLASIDIREGNYSDARSNLQKSLPIQQALGDRAGEAASWHQLASIDIEEGNYPDARSNTKKSLLIEQAIGNRAGEAASWHQLASIDFHEGNYSDARANTQKSLLIKQAIGNRAGEASSWHQLASIGIHEGSYSDAREMLQKSHQILQAIGNRAGEAASWHQLATIDIQEGNYSDARANLQKSLPILQAIGDRAGEAASWHQLASIDIREGNYLDARSNLQKSLKIKQAIGDRAGEAASWHQLGVLTFRIHGASKADLHLSAVAWVIKNSIGDGTADQSLDGLTQDAIRLELSPEELQTEIAYAMESYQADRGASLLAAAFPEEHDDA